MRIIAAWLALGLSAWAQAPDYSAATVVNAASGAVGELAPNTIASIYGKYLADSIAAVGASQIQGGFLPDRLPPSGAIVSIAGYTAPLYYASPTQINFLVPLLTPGEVTLQVFRDGWAGPTVQVTIAPATPGLFQSYPADPAEPAWAIVTHLDGSLVTPAQPGGPGEVLVLWATGLGSTSPLPITGELAPGAAQVSATVQVLLDGQALAPGSVLYAGLTPGYAGLYQVNVRLPDTLASSQPEIRLAVGDRLSAAGIRLATQPSP